MIGQSGLEAQYERYLQGVDGTEKVQVNASGEPTGHVSSLAPTAGDTLVTSLDAGLEREGMAAVQHAMASARALGNPADSGAFIAMDPFSGRVYAVGSYPSYNPNWFADGLTTAEASSAQWAHRRL